jgi:MscS family membrane protein
MRLPIDRLSMAILLVLTIALLSLPTIGIAQTPTMNPSTPTEGTPETSRGGPASKVNDAVDSLAARTPIPTPDPSFVQREVADFTESVGWSDITFLRLSVEDWINLALSMLLFLLTYWAALWFLGHILRRLILRTETKFDDEFFTSIERELKWLIGVLLLNFSFLRLAFIPGSFRTALNDILFVVGLVLLVRIAVKLIDFSLDWYETYLDSQKQPNGIDPAIVMLRHAGKLLVLVTGVSIGLSHFGLVSNTIVIVLLVVAVLVLFSIKDIMTDIIYGFIILVGQPFRVGDAIHVDLMDGRDWGWVAEIGSRETRIRTRDNRMLVIPNALLGSGKVVNYMSPDPSYRVQTELHVVYGSDFSHVRQVLEQATRGVEGVLADKPVEVLFRNFGMSGRTVLVRWWIASCEQDFDMVDQVNAALEKALVAGDIQIAFTKLDVQVDGQTVGQSDDQTDNQ